MQSYFRKQLNELKLYFSPLPKNVLLLCGLAQTSVMFSALSCWSKTSWQAWHLWFLVAITASSNHFCHSVQAWWPTSRCHCSITDQKPMGQLKSMPLCDDEHWLSIFDSLPYHLPYTNKNINNVLNPSFSFSGVHFTARNTLTQYFLQSL